MKAFHGDPKVKEKYLARVKAHRKADEIVKGLYWEDGKGCAVGCTIHGENHRAYEKELGIPIQIAHLQDWLFEHLPNGEAKGLPVDFLEAIPVGADLKLVLPRFFHWILVDPDGVIQYAQGEGEERAKEAILSVAALHNRVVKGQEVTSEQWSAARAAARAARAAARAARGAAWAASESAWAAARDAAWAASAAAWGAARAAAWAASESAMDAAWDAAKDAAIKRQKEKLLELLAGESVLHERGYGQVRK